MEARVGNVDARMSGLEARMTAVETVLADLDGRVKSWPDMHYLAAAAKAQLTQTREIKADLAEARIRVDEIFQAMATDSEIRNMREDVARFREQSLDAEIRLGAIEGRLGLQAPVEPR
ncbi:MAG: hypothetical protein KGM15_04640 [Pseudomonadota bacterium]|nr:hypothetical protein [Pseudomonadota bacterium]